jgi:5-methylcytosine-specific restriction endonuclease McrA
MPKRALPKKQRKPEVGGTACKRGYDRRWRKLRARKLAEDPLCEHCLVKDMVTAASEVDHIIRHQGQSDPLFWLWSNLQSLCKPCHSRKTMVECGIGSR